MEEIRTLQKDDEKFAKFYYKAITKNNFSCIKQILLKRE